MKNLGKAAAAKNELLLLALDGVGGRDEQLGLALVLHPAVPAPVQCVGEVRGQLVGELVHVFARENPSGVLVPQVGGEDVKVLVEEALELLVGDGAAGLHLRPLDAQRARQLQPDASKRGCLQHKHLQIVSPFPALFNSICPMPHYTPVHPDQYHSINTTQLR